MNKRINTNIVACLACIALFILAGCGDSKPRVSTTVTIADPPEGKLLDLEASGDRDFATFVPTPALEIYTYLTKEGTGIKITGSSDEGGTTGFRCVNVRKGNLTASTSAGYQSSFENIKDESITLDIPLDEDSSYVTLFGYSGGVDCQAEILDAGGTSLATETIATPDKQAWQLQLAVNMKPNSTIRVELTPTFSGKPPVAGAFAIGAALVSSNDKLHYTDGRP